MIPMLATKFMVACHEAVECFSLADLGIRLQCVEGLGMTKRPPGGPHTASPLRALHQISLPLLQPTLHLEWHP
jgi:hypothetical protein